MTTLLIVESNTPDLVDAGNSGALGFVQTLAAVAPDVISQIAGPYARPDTSVDWDTIDAVIFSGSSVTWSVDAPEAAPLRRMMEHVFHQGLPTWGSCNGLHLAALLLGGRVAPSPNGMELGLAQDIAVTIKGSAHPMMAGRASPFSVPCLHRDEVRRMPKGAQRLAGNTHTSVQAMAYYRHGVDFWGTQYHPELSAADVARSFDLSGLFKDRYDLSDDLARIEIDETVARRFATSCVEQSVSQRANELLNWLQHIGVSMPKATKARPQEMAPLA